MKLRTLENLEDELYREFAWRREELSTIEGDFTPRNVIVPRARVRAGITILYAHWEGGIKAMANAYLAYVKNQPARYEQLDSGMLGFLLGGKFSELEVSTRFARNRVICREILQALKEQAKFPTVVSVDTGSNLTSERLTDILAAIGLEEHLFSTKHILIDALVRARNDAAHGDNVVVDKSDFLRFYQPVIDALELFRDRLIEAGNSRHYLLQP